MCMTCGCLCMTCGPVFIQPVSTGAVKKSDDSGLDTESVIILVVASVLLVVIAVVIVVLIVVSQ